MWPQAATTRYEKEKAEHQHQQQLHISYQTPNAISSFKEETLASAAHKLGMCGTDLSNVSSIGFTSFTLSDSLVK